MGPQTSDRLKGHPPADMEKWSAICLGIIRHYNEGWADGFHHNIRCWEIWNEPENRPAMWSGTDDDYFKLYRSAACAIKKQFPALMVGGPSLGATGSFVAGEFVPTDFTTGFLTMCRKENVPLNFFSWHCYTAKPAELTARSRAIRRLLDSKGFTETESHLNEWNFLPGNTWNPISKSGSPDGRTRFYDEMAGALGAAFISTSLLELQNAPVDVCNFFHGELGAFGVFTEQGRPQKAYQALRAFQGLVENPRRVETRGAVPGRLAFTAGLSMDGREATMLVSNFADPRSDIILNWKAFAWTGGVTAEIHFVDANREFSDARIEALGGEGESLHLTMKAPALALIRLRPTVGTTAKPTLSVTSPANRLIFQRSQTGYASIHVAGSCAWPGAEVEARILSVSNGKAGDWASLGTVQSDFKYQGKLISPAGWYSLEVRVRGEGNTAIASVDRVGVGEVFVVVGRF